MLLIGCYLKVYENELTPCYTRFYLNTIKKTYIVFFFLQPLTTNRAVSPNNGRRRTLRSTKRYQQSNRTRNSSTRTSSSTKPTSSPTTPSYSVGSHVAYPGRSRASGKTFERTSVEVFRDIRHVPKLLGDSDSCLRSDQSFTPELSDDGSGHSWSNQKFDKEALFTTTMGVCF